MVLNVGIRAFFMNMNELRIGPIPVLVLMYAYYKVHKYFVANKL